MKFTDRSIEAIKAKAKRFTAWEDNGKGFGIRVSPSGKKSWIYLYRFDGRSRRMTLGVFPDMGLADAHEAHAKAKKELSKGIDPGEKDQAKKADHRNAFTVANLVDEYMERHAKKKKITWREDLRCFNKDVLPFIGKRKARDIENRDIVLLRDRIMDRGAEMMANRVHNCLTKLFNFGIERGLLKASPCAALALPAEKVQRDRALSDAEIKIFWNSLDGTGMKISRQLALRLLLVTAQRRSEVVGAKWQEFNLNERVWEIPLERIKTRKKRKKTGPHLVPLNDLALSLLDEIKTVSNGSPFLFPWKTPGQHFPPTAVTSSLSRALDKKNQNRIKVEHFTPHDLRRTATTGMTAVGISQAIAGKVLNHAEVGVTATVYDKYNYFPEKKDALNRWGRKLESIITGVKGKVIKIRA
ncbi:MAG: tyrosine-type recombinase/integrase [Nitrospinae bacterium]|nr:tyrosine-type recombinase/integrase [Nitrospinota bacterium]